MGKLCPLKGGFVDKEKAHFYISTLKRLLIDNPDLRRDEFTKEDGINAKAICDMFGSFGNMLEAVGHKRSKPSKVDISELDKIIGDRSSVKKIRLNAYKRIVALGDFHAPFECRASMKKAIEVIKKINPDVVVQVGDLFDLYSASKFPRSHNVYTPKAEFELARRSADALWSAVKAVSPKSQKFQLLGNHDSRIAKRVIEKWPEGESLIAPVVKQMFSFDGVTTIHDATEELMIGNITVIHGYASGFGAHRDYNVTNVICGHTHRGGVSFRSYGPKTLWELNCGFLGNANSKGLDYRPQKLSNWTLGVGVVDELGPRFVSF